jgi:hypothetical protein
LNLLRAGLLRPLTENSNLELAHRSFEARKHPVVQEPRIVDALGIHNESLGQNAQIDEVMSVPVVSRQTRCFQGEYGSHLAIAHRRQEPGKPRTFMASGTGEAQILVHDHDVFEPQLFGPALERKLAASTLRVVAHLLQSRLTDVNKSRPIAMTLVDFVSHGILRPSLDDS